MRADPDPAPERRERAAGSTVTESVSPAARRFAAELRDLHEAAGSPEYRLLAAQAARQRPPVNLSVSSISDWLTGKSVPSSETAVRFVVAFLQQRARTPQRPMAQWLRLHSDAQARPHRRRGGRPSRRPAAEPEALAPELASLLRQMRMYAEELPYPQAGRHRRVLSGVYVRQSVASPVQVRRRVLDPELDELAMIEEDRRVTGLAQPFDEVFGQHDHLVVEGGAGLGKSTLGRHLVGDIAATLLDGHAPDPATAGLVPVMLPARVLAEHADRIWTEALHAAVTTEYGILADGTLPAEAFQQQIGGRRWLVIVDALDEIPDPASRDRLLKALSRLMAVPGPARFLITSRPLEPGEIAQLQGPQVGFFELQPFDEADLDDFARRYFDPDTTGFGTHDATEFLAQVRRAGLGQVLTVPLLATVAAKVFVTRSKDQPLPSSRYELYEQYIADFTTARANSAAEVFAATGNDELCTWLDAHRTDLLEHLADRYTRSETPLAEEATRYLADRAPLPAGVPPNWDTMVGDWLCRTGLLGRHGVRLRFTHLTFAEHLAANARAGALPPTFTATEPVWATLLTQLLLDDESAERTILHYLHRCAPGHGLLSHLQGRGRSDQQHAAALIEKGAPCTETELSGYLDMLEARVFADLDMDLHDTAGPARHLVVQDRLLTLLRDDRVSIKARAAIVDVLRDRSAAARVEGALLLKAVLADANRPADVRTDAAHTLVRLGDPYRSRAIEMLVHIAASPNESGAHRYEAAEILATLGASRRSEAAELLREIASDVTVEGWDRRKAAEQLAKLGRENRLSAADLLHDRAVDPMEYAVQRRQAAEALAGLGGEHRASAIVALRRTSLHLSAADTSERLTSLAAAALLEPDGRDRAASLLSQLAMDPWSLNNARLTAAQGLATLGGEHRAQAGVLLHRLSTGLTLPQEHVRLAAATELASMGHRHQNQAGDALGRIAIDPATPYGTRVKAAREIARLGANWHALAAQVLLSVTTAEPVSLATRFDAAFELAKLSEADRNEVTRIFRGLAGNPSVTPDVGVLAAAVLVAVAPDSSAALASPLHRLAVTAGGHHAARVLAADTLVWLGGEEVDRAAELLRAAATDQASTDASRIEALGRLARLGDRHRKDALEIFRRLAPRALLALTDYVGVINALAGFSHLAPAETAEILATAVNDPLFDDDALAWMMYKLRTLTHSSALRAAETLVSVLEEPLRNPPLLWPDDLAALCRCRPVLAPVWHDRMHHDTALSALERCDQTLNIVGADEGHCGWATAALREMAGRLGETDPERGPLLACADAVETGDRQLFVKALAAVVDNAASTPDLAVAAAIRLAEESPPHRDGLIDVYRRLVSDSRLSYYDRRRVAEKLNPLDLAATTDAIAAILTDPSAPASERYLVARQLTSTGSGTLAATALREMAAAPVDETDARITAAVTLVNLGTEHIPTVAPILADLLIDPSSSVTDRVRAGRELAALGVQHAASVQAVVEALLEDEDAGPEDRAVSAAVMAWLRPESKSLARHTLTRLAIEAWDGSRLPITQVLVAVGAVGDVAASLFERVVADTTESDQNRVDAAKGCLELETAEPGRGLAALLQIAEDPTATAAARVEAATAHAKFAHAARADAAAALATIASGIRIPHADRLAASRILALIEPSRRPTIAAALHDLAEDTTRLTGERCDVAEALTRYSHTDGERAASTLAAIASDLGLKPWERQDAASTLLRLGGANRTVALRLLDDLATDPATDPGDRALALAEVLVVDPGRRETVARDLHATATDPLVSATDRLEAAKHLVNAGGADSAAPALQSVAADRTVDVQQRCDAAASLHRLGTPWRAQATDLVWQIAKDETLGALDRLTAIRRLIVWEQPTEALAVVLCSILDWPSAAGADQRNVAKTLSWFGSATRHQAVAYLVDLLDGVDDAERLKVCDRLYWLGPAGRRAAAERLRAMIAEGSPTRLVHRAEAAATLSWIDARHTGSAVHLLVEAARDRAGTTAWERVDTVETLLELDTAHAETAAGLLQAVATEEDLRAWERLRAAKALGRLGVVHRERAADLMGELARSSWADSWESADCAVARENLDARHRDETIAFLETLAAGATDIDQVRYVAEQLLLYGKPARPAAAEALARVAEDASASAEERAEAAAMAIRIGGTAAVRGSDVFRQLTTDASKPAFDRAMAFDTWTSVRAEQRPNAAPALETVATDLTEPSDHRRRAAQALAELGTARRPQALAVLTNLADDTTASNADRALATAALVPWDARHKAPAATALDALDLENLNPELRLRAAEALMRRIPTHLGARRDIYALARTGTPSLRRRAFATIRE